MLGFYHQLKGNILPLIILIWGSFDLRILLRSLSGFVKTGAYFISSSKKILPLVSNLNITQDNYIYLLNFNISGALTLFKYNFFLLPYNIAEIFTCPKFQKTPFKFGLKWHILKAIIFCRNFFLSWATPLSFPTFKPKINLWVVKIYTFFFDWSDKILSKSSIQSKTSLKITLWIGQ